MKLDLTHPQHRQGDDYERRVGERLQRALPGVGIYFSSEVPPKLREFERNSPGVSVQRQTCMGVFLSSGCLVCCRFFVRSGKAVFRPVAWDQVRGAKMTCDRDFLHILLRASLSGRIPSKNRSLESSPLEATAVGMRQADYLVHRAERLDEIGRCRLKRIEPVGLPRARDYSNGIIPLKYVSRNV